MENLSQIYLIIGYTSQKWQVRDCAGFALKKHPLPIGLAWKGVNATTLQEKKIRKDVQGQEKQEKKAVAL